MAELRRVGGDLVPHRQPGGRRVLLPAEAELCNAIGISEDDYWHFVDLTQAYNGERAKEYELIPDVRSDLVTLIVNLVIGIALSAISALLAPKPRTPEQRTPPNLKTADQTGAKRFAPQTSFDSVQELAALGATIPLIFTRKGVRVNATLLWSQMLSLGTSQQLRAILLFGSRIEQSPEFAGFAIGDTLLENYTRAKVALYFRPGGGRLHEPGNRYGEGTAENVPHADAFSLFWDRSGDYQPFFSGVRTPSTQTQFGAFSPMPNGNAFRLNYELILVPKEADTRVKRDLRTKRDKLNRWYPCRSAIIVNNGTGAVYRIEGGQEDPGAYKPWGLEDVNSAVEAIRVNSDDSCAVGDLYLVGERFAVGKYISTSEPWTERITKDFHLWWSDESPYGQVDVRGIGETHAPYSSLVLQRAAVAVVSNNRDCDATEVGLKSTVWKQINGFPNVNSQPDQATIEDYEDKNGSISLGAISKYVSRLSFFRIFARPLGRNAGWDDISGGTLFCVKGQTPQAQYNYFRFVHGRGQYEFKFVPVPGNIAHRFFTNRDVWLLRPGTRLSFNAGGYTVVFSGVRFRLTASAQSNTEWILGAPPPPATGEVTGMNRSQNGTILPDSAWVYVDRGDPTLFRSFIRAVLSSQHVNYEYYWDYKLIYAYSDNDSTTPRSVEVKGYQYRPGARIGSSQHKHYYIERYQWRSGLNPPVIDQIVNAVGGSGSGLQFRIRSYANGASEWSIHSKGQNYISGETVTIPVINQSVTIESDDRGYLQNNVNPYDAVADYTLYEAERTSHMDGPEHEVVYVCEQLQQVPPQYDNLAIAGLRINSSKEWASFSNLSAFIKRGTAVERLTTTGVSASNLLPEIAYALLTDNLIGAGQTIGASQVDRERMTTAARFCEANGFTWDGLIAEKINLREWIFEQAGYCLLDFTILGGRFSLIPSVPYSSDYTINFDGRPEIKALFTDGNIRKMQVSWLSPEERRPFRAACLWRQDKDNGFPETRVLTVRLSEAEGGHEGDPEETFDMSGWCTTQEHAFTFARYALKLRQLVDHAVTFETTPQAAMNLAPGEYFRLASEVTHTSRFNNGSISPTGSIQSVDVLDGSYSILFWEPGTVGVRQATLNAAAGATTQSELFGTVFTLNTTTTTNRVYKVETLSYGEDGLVEVAASHVPLTDTGSMAVLRWSTDMFVVETG